jgi:hypothetical protein
MAHASLSLSSHSVLAQAGFGSPAVDTLTLLVLVLREPKALLANLGLTMLLCWFLVLENNVMIVMLDGMFEV